MSHSSANVNQIDIPYVSSYVLKDNFFVSILLLKRLVVCLEESLYIHNIRDMKVLHTIRDTPPNPNGICAISVNTDNSFLAYPGSSQIGEVQIFDTINLVSNYSLTT